MVEGVNIVLSGIKKEYDRPILNNVCLNIANYDYISILGRSGAGKSTLMNILGLIESFDEGTYTFNGISIKQGKDYSKIRREKIGFIFQSYNLIPTLTCIENIMLPTQYSNKNNCNLEEIIYSLKISHLLDKNVVLLSGGEKQRVAIARALILNPSLIIADEPTGNLDISNTNVVLDLLKKENKKGRAIVMITHDEKVASMAKNIYRLENGVLNEII